MSCRAVPVQVTANRELDREASETENALRALKDQSQHDLLLLRQKRDGLRASNADLRASVDAHRRRTGELDDILRETTLSPLTPASSCIKRLMPPCQPVCACRYVYPHEPIWGGVFFRISADLLAAKAV